MDFRRREVGEHRICATALDSSAGGFVASVEVRRLSDDAAAQAVLWREEALFDGRTFYSAHEALCRALDCGYAKLRRLGLVPESVVSSS